MSNNLQYAIDVNINGNKIQQLAPSPSLLTEPIDYESEINKVVQSWRDSFTYKQEEPEHNIIGLRLPQIGSIHAIHAHWTVSEGTATIVLPTGTGKTETMLSILVTKRCQRLLVVVPTDALRTQISDKFLKLGILKEIGVVSAKARLPIVGILRHIPKTINEVDTFFTKCQVIVTTMKIVAESESEIQERIAHYCPFLFIDEAHHIAASTWSRFVEKFQDNSILQFTATPFRNDGKPVSGKIIFNYPLSRAQTDGYFKPINFKPVFEFDPERSDFQIAKKAIEQLKEDLQQGFDHILMARVNSIKRASEVFEIYNEHKEYNPVQIHTGITSAQEREAIRQQIINKQARIVVCVDMLGEGFDLPELKIAAFHDVRQSLPVTLQLAGRFTRARHDLGDATFIANVGDIVVQEELQNLYSQDSDWNRLLPRSSETLIQDQIDLWDLVEGFGESTEIPLQNVKLALSTVIYKTECDEWTPDNFKKGLPSPDFYDWVKHDINHEKNVLIILAANKVPLPWINSEDIQQWDLSLYVIYWDKSQNLLFINQSNNKGYFKKLAEAVAGHNVTLITGNNVFRSLSGINRLRLQNVGLKEERGRLISYTLRAGTDVEPAITAIQRQSTSKTNLFGIGFENGKKTSIGCTRKGRIWSMQQNNIDFFIKWCSRVGSKVIDENIDHNEFLQGTIVPKNISERPNKMAVAIQWPDTMYQNSEKSSRIFINEISFYLYEAELNLLNPSDSGDIEFEIRSEKIAANFALRLIERNGNIDFFIESTDQKKVLIEHGRQINTASQFFFENSPTIWFVDGSSLTGSEYIELPRNSEPYSESNIIRWDWSGTNIQRESQGIDKEVDSIQYRVIQELQKGDYEIIFDDDDPGEAADVVTIKTTKKTIEVNFYHCKYSLSDQPGARIKDLYEVCGQAQKSIRWADNPTELFNHLLRREPRKRAGEEFTRFEAGNKKKLIAIGEMSKQIPITLRIFIVQPGLSNTPSVDQLQLLSVTENHLMEYCQLPFRVIASI